MCASVLSKTGGGQGVTMTVRNLSYVLCKVFITSVFFMQLIASLMMKLP